MAGLPTVQVLLDDGTGTFPYDLTNLGGKSYVRIGHQINRGRQDELADVTPGQLQNLTLDNTDGRFTPGSTIIASPSPIKADARIRIKETANGTTVTRFTGYVQQWPVGWPSGGDTLSEVTVTATDAQARAERRPLKSVIQEEVRLDGPVAQYTLGEPAGAASAADSSGNQAPALTMVGTGTAVTFGTATGPGTDGLTAAQFSGGQYLQGSVSQTVALTEVAFLTSTANRRLISMYKADGSTFDILGIDASGHLTGPFSMTSSAVVTDGAEHVGGLRWTGSQVQLLLDGVVVASNVDTRAGSSAQIMFLGEPPVGGSAYSGTMAHVAFFTTDPGGARATAHATASLTGFDGESGTARLTRLAGYGGLPIGTLDSSLTNVPFTDFTGQSLAQALRDVADGEFGLLFVDGSGNLTFHNRNRSPAKATPDVTITADMLDPGTGFQYDTQGLVNYFEATAKGTGVTQVARNTASETQHGRYPTSGTYLVQTDAEAIDRANWVVANHADPAPRLGSLTIDLLTLDTATQAALLAAEPNTWLRVTGLPSQTPGGTTADLVVQGFAETLTKDSWSITFNVISRSLVQAWILGDATYGVLDSTTRLYV